MMTREAKIRALRLIAEGYPARAALIPRPHTVVIMPGEDKSSEIEATRPDTVLMIVPASVKEIS